MEELLKVEHLVKSFGTNNVLKDIDFSVNKGDVISIIGSSGSGKSTLLRCINMLEDATDGNIFFHGKNVLKGESMKTNTALRWVWCSRASISSTTWMYWRTVS